MADAVLELIGLVVPRLKTSGPVSALVGQKIYDRVPAMGSPIPVAAFPYISIGAVNALEFGAECIDALDIMLRVDIWSREAGMSEGLRIAGAVRKALHEFDGDLSENALVEIRHRRTDRMLDADGITNHVIVEFSAVVETH